MLAKLTRWLEAGLPVELPWVTLLKARQRHHNLGSILYKLGCFDESTAAYRQSLELRPDCASTYLHLG